LLVIYLKTGDDSSIALTRAATPETAPMELAGLAEGAGSLALTTTHQASSGAM